MFEVRQQFTGIKSKIFGLMAAFSLQTPANSQDVNFSLISREVSTVSSTNIIYNNSDNIQLKNFSFNIPDSSGSPLLKHKIKEPSESHLWVKLQSVIENSSTIKDPEKFIKLFEDLLKSEVFRPEGCSRLQYAAHLIEQISEPEKNIYQGKRATCGATNIQYAMARFLPELYAEFAISAATASQYSFSLENNINSYLIPKDGFRQDDSRRDAVSRIVQTCLMEALNGDELLYNNSFGFHYNQQGRAGKGVKMEAAMLLLSELLQKEFRISEANSQIIDIDKLAEIASSQPVVVSLKWRKLSEQEILSRIEQTGAEREKYVDDDGYLGHMLTLYGVKGDQVMLKSTWSPFMHSKYENSQTIGPETTPVGRYDKEKALIIMDKAEFLSRLKKVIY